MRIEFVSHACLFVEAGGTRFATDPWWEGPCYARQWNVFPQPVSADKVDLAETILLSHGHADHLNEATLRTLTPGKTAFYPYYWYGGTPEWLRELGFARVVEAASERTYALGEGAEVTFLVCGQDAIMVIEADGQVLVNVNDALHSTSPRTIDLYCRRIAERWPRIDYLFCGYGGASYFPNVFHAPHKDDRAIGRLRETLFIDAFCRIAATLRPRIAVPFAADFVLLNRAQRWINEVRFPREAVPAYFDRHWRTPDIATEVVVMYPGDAFEDGELRARSPYRARLENGSIDHLIDEQYPIEVSVFASGRTIDGTEADAVAGALAAHLPTQTVFYPREQVEGLRFAVQLTDVAGPNWYNVALDRGGARVERADAPAPDAVVRIRTAHDALMNSIGSDWGGDDIIIGYGCEIHVASPADMKPARVAAELLVRHPRPEAYARRHPWRTLRYVGQTWFAARAKIAAKLGRGVADASDPVGTDAWLTDDAEVIRTRLGLPDRHAAPAALATRPAAAPEDALSGS